MFSEYHDKLLHPTTFEYYVYIHSIPPRSCYPGDIGVVCNKRHSTEEVCI